MENNIYKVYGLIHPKNNMICYIGVTKQKLNRRLLQHNNPRPENRSWIAKAKRSLKDLKFDIVLLKDFDNEEDMYNYEIFLIDYYRKNNHKLYNLQDGGINSSNPKKSINQMIESRKINGKWNSLKGEENGNSILDTDKILDIYKMILDFKSNSEIQLKYNIKKSHMTAIRKGKIWNHLWVKHLNIYIPSMKSSINNSKLKLEIIELFNKGYNSYDVHKMYPHIKRFDLERIQNKKLWKNVWKIYENYKARYNRNIINESGEFGGSLNEKIPSQASEEEGVTTIPEMGVHSSEWKRQTPRTGDDIVCSYR